jgi:hypothetical protein
MNNKINDLLNTLHTGLDVCENGGDVHDYLPYLVRLEALIARVKGEPELLDGFDPDGIANAHLAIGEVWCESEERWRESGDPPVRWPG